MRIIGILLIVFTFMMVNEWWNDVEITSPASYDIALGPEDGPRFTDNVNNPNSLNSDQVKFLCRAYISAVFGKDIDQTEVYLEKDGQTFVRYTRRSDGVVWANRCSIVGGRFVWASTTGRWRNSTADEVISYSRSLDELIVEQRFADGSASKSNFELPIGLRSLEWL